MARRGSQLREHILLAAKEVFLEMGFERASMDAVAARAETSKRSLYAHFESKERLFLAVVEFVRGLVLSRLQTPSDYSDDPAEALTLFCVQYQAILLYEATIRMCRLSMAEAVRFPEGAAQYFDVLFTQVHARLRAYFETALGLPVRAADDAAQGLLGRVIHPRFPRALFGVDSPAPQIEPSAVDSRPVRRAVEEVLAALPERQDAG